MQRRIGADERFRSVPCRAALSRLSRSVTVPGLRLRGVSNSTSTPVTPVMSGAGIRRRIPSGQTRQAWNSGAARLRLSAWMIPRKPLMRRADTTVRDGASNAEALDAVCRRLGVRMLVLFGSRAPGGLPAGEDSDVDLAFSLQPEARQRGAWDLHEGLAGAFPHQTLDIVELSATASCTPPSEPRSTSTPTTWPP
jgi:predicted nucleotidyltransferase